MIAMGMATLLIAGIFVLFSSQIASIAKELSSFESKLSEIFDVTLNYLNSQVAILPEISKRDILEQGQEIAKKSGGSIVASTLDQTGSIFSGALMSFVYTFLFLLYRSGLKKAVLQSASQSDRDLMEEMMNKMQKVGQSYLSGITVMIGILGSANSLVLLLFGLENAIFFGFLAAFLAVIPYIGTAIGAILPVIYAFMTHDTVWVPFGIAISFWGIQVVESNYLTPRIVGGNMNLNALAAILSLILGGYLWGIAGMILFLPLAAIFKVFCEYHTPLKPIALLLSSHLDEG
ncbi:MAG: hypothetical protein Tsb0034_19990 [Ekhidna sp.]